MLYFESTPYDVKSIKQGKTGNYDMVGMQKPLPSAHSKNKNKVTTASTATNTE